MKIIKDIFLKFKSEIFYIIFGVLTTVVNIASYYIFFEILNVSNVLSTAISWVIAVLFAYVTNRKFVFNSKTKEFKGLLKEITAFFMCRLLTGFMDLAIMFVAVDILDWNSMLWKFLSNILVIILNYFFSKIFVFKGN